MCDVLGSSIDISGCQGYSQDVRVTLYTLVTFPWYTFGVMSWDHPWTSADVKGNPRMSELLCTHWLLFRGILLV